MVAPGRGWPEPVVEGNPEGNTDDGASRVGEEIPDFGASGSKPGLIDLDRRTRSDAEGHPPPPRNPEAQGSEEGDEQQDVPSGGVELGAGDGSDTRRGEQVPHPHIQPVDAPAVGAEEQSSGSKGIGKDHQECKEPCEP